MVRKVLIVEDIDICAATLEIALLKVPGLIVKSATSAEQALRLLSDGGGDISALITDIHLPRMDGFELIEQVRSQPRFSHLPILVISGDSDPNTRTVDAHVVRLRQKLEPDANTPRHFITVHGVGYRFLP